MRRLRPDRSNLRIFPEFGVENRQYAALRKGTASDTITTRIRRLAGWVRVLKSLPKVRIGYFSMPRISVV